MYTADKLFVNNYIKDLINIYPNYPIMVLSGTHQM